MGKKLRHIVTNDLVQDHSPPASARQYSMSTLDSRGPAWRLHSPVIVPGATKGPLLADSAPTLRGGDKVALRSLQMQLAPQPGEETPRAVVCTHAGAYSRFPLNPPTSAL